MLSLGLTQYCLTRCAAVLRHTHPIGNRFSGVFMSKWWWQMRQVSRKLWVRTSLIGSLGVTTALLAAFVERWIPWELPGFVSVSDIESLLTIIASSMLAVTTFSLGVMTSAYGAASSSVTPRATKLLMEDSITQTVLSSFIGSFIFSIVGIIVLRFGAYGERGRVVLFMVTIAVLAQIVVNLLRWINYLTSFGRMGETIGRVEAVTEVALQQRLSEPYLGGHNWISPHAVPPGATVIGSGKVGYVQHIDMPALSEAVQAMQGQLYVAAPPGKHVFVDSPLAWLVCPASNPTTQTAPCSAEDAAAQLRVHFTIGDERNFEQDPRFGLAVMCEIASRALSPATNDPGTALDVIARSTRLLSCWAQGLQARDAQNIAVQYPQIWVPALSSQDLFEDAFMLMARDGAGLIEIQLRLQKSLAALARQGNAEFRAAAQAQAELALARVEQAMALEQDKQRLRYVVRALQDRSNPAQ